MYYESFKEQVIRRLAEVAGVVDQLAKQLIVVLSQLRDLKTLGAKMSVELDDLKAKVAANTTVIGSAKALLVGLKASLDAAIAELPNKAALMELSAKLATDDQELADAVVASTPAAPVVPEPTP